MKMLWYQSSEPGVLSRLGIADCSFKRLHFGADTYVSTDKRHFHNEFEVHIVLCGQQAYELEAYELEAYELACGELADDELTDDELEDDELEDDKLADGEFGEGELAEGDIKEGELSLVAGSVLVIPPWVLHRAVGADDGTVKLALTFKPTEELGFSALPLERAVSFSLSDRLREGLDFVIAEAEYSRELSGTLIENRLFEIIVTLLREAGADEGSREPSIPTGSPILSMAKQYIHDNIESAVTVHDIARYCHISDKQLTRIFLRYEGCPASEYIRERRLECARRLLSDRSLTLKRISEQMNFGSEYYFNAFIKKNCGLSPGAYRKYLDPDIG